MPNLKHQLTRMNSMITLMEGRVHWSEDEILKYLKLNNIPFNKVSYIGSGEFGNAYWLGNGKVLKITTSESEYEIASQILNKKLPGLVTFYFAATIGNNFRYALVMDEVDTDSSIEDDFSRVEMILSTQGLGISYEGLTYFNEDDYDQSEGELDTKIEKFMWELRNIFKSCHEIGIRIPDINYGNLGYNNAGVLTAFDLHDRAKTPNSRW